MGKQRCLGLLLYFCIGLCLLGLGRAAEEENNSNHDVDATKTNPHNIPSSCSLVLAESSIPNAGWGVFSLTDRPRGQEVIPGDVVIQVGDLNTTHAAHARKLAMDYGWNAAETGGQYEGLVTMSVVPGIGMVANGSPRSFNVLPKLEPNVDEGEVTRHQSPGAGSFSHYHNFSFFLQSDLEAGDEIMVNYGPKYFERHGEVKDEEESTQKMSKPRRPVESLLKEGFCLDNLRPDQSTIPNAGRGAFATRDMTQGTVVAPMPVLPITSRKVMDITRMRKVSPDVSVPSTSQQLLLNYVYSHPKSSVMLLPFSPIVNLINHSQKRTNVKLQWSSVNKQHEALTLEDLEQINTGKESSSGSLLLELVATRDIKEGEEILLNYGSLWQEAWNRHEKEWEPYQKSYAPAYVMEEAVPVLATQEELKGADQSNSYPPNLITSCFYPYAHPPTKPERDITKAEWKSFPGIFELRNLRPCTVMQRHEVKQEQKGAEGTEQDEAEPTFLYTVVIRNRYGLPTHERIPAGHMHVVTGVPRRAIRFTDKIYTTDQHLPGAFRHEIGLDDDVFPSQWMDL